MLEFLLEKAPRTRKGLIYHNHIENMIWVDAFYMAPPFLAVAGHPDEAVKQLEGYRETLRHPEKGAYYHMWDEDRQRFERKLLWGVGNGWAAAGMTRVIRALPAEGVTVLLVEQNLKLAELIADQIFVMVKGRVVYAATPDRLRAEEDDVRRRYLTL